MTASAPRRRRARALLAALCMALMGALWSGPATAQTFQLNDVVFDGSDYLSDADIRAVTARYVGRPIGFADLQAMIGELNALYLQAGVLTAQVVLPPQEVRGGVLRVALIEAEISEVELVDMPRTSAEFMRRNLSLPIGGKPDFDQIERDLMIFDIAHDIAPQLSFAPGETPGTTRAEIRAEEPRRFAFTASVDNFGRDETGAARATVFGRWSSVTGVRDTLSFQAQKSEGAGSASLGYSRPVGPGGGRVVGALSFSTSSIIGGEFEPVRIVSDSLSGSLSYRRPAYVRPDRYVIFETGLSYETTQSSIEETDFADIEVYDAFFTARYNRRFARATLGFSGGLRAGRAEALGTSETEGDFWLLYGEGAYARPLSDTLMLNANLRYQYAYGQNLPVARLITAGGVGSVRGYPSDVRGGDSGVVLNLQLSAREAIRPAAAPALAISPFGFVDAAVIVPFRTEGGLNSDQDFLASLGGGVSMSIGERANVLAMVGVPLVDTLGFEDSGTANFYLGIDYEF